MTYTQFREIVLSLGDYPDQSEQSLELFIHERGWQEWMDGYYDESGKTDRITPILQAIWQMRDNPIKGIKKATKHTNESLSLTYGIPRRTVEDWARGVRECPAYTSTMLAYCVFADKGII